MTGGGRSRTIADGVGLLLLGLGVFRIPDGAEAEQGVGSAHELLIATAQVLREELRTADFVSRPGGDEFIVLLPDSDEQAATTVAAKLVHAFRGVRRPRPDGGEVELRASVGIAVANGEPRTNARALLAAADRALYSAKQAGGDRFALGAVPAIG